MSDEIGRIPLRRKDGSIAAWALVDAADFDELNAHSWYLGSRGYAMRQYRAPGMMRGELMHRRVLGLVRGDGRQADHVNGDKLDNRRANLRVATQSQNEQNKTSTRAASGFRNVAFAKGRGWFARVAVDGKSYVRGYFETPELAAPHAEDLRRAHHPFSPEGGA